MTDLAADIRSVTESKLRPRVREIDRDGTYPADILQDLGRVGAFAQHHSGMPDHDAAALGPAIEATAIVAEECLSTAFCTWCQNALGWYIENTSNTELRDQLRYSVAFGEVLGGTGLSNPIKALSGIEKFRLHGRRESNGWRVSGALPWVSNLGDGHLFGICFAVEGAPTHLVMSVVRCGDPGIELRQNAHFIALEGTATMSVVFHDAFVADAMVLAEAGEPFIQRIRAGFVLLQTGMALGLVRGCIKAMHGTVASPDDANVFLLNGPDDLQDSLQEVSESIHVLAKTPYERDPDYLRRVLRARLQSAELALAAAQSMMFHAGARGYLQGSVAERRIREAFFISIVTPSAKHLRKDLHRMSHIERV